MSKFKFGDRVTFVDTLGETRKGTVIRLNSQHKRYCIVDAIDLRGVVDPWYDWTEEDALELLPKTKNEILKDMIDGAEYLEKSVGKISFEGLRFKWSIDSAWGWVSNLTPINFTELTRIEKPTKKEYKLELTEEEYARVKEILK